MCKCLWSAWSASAQADVRVLASQLVSQNLETVNLFTKSLHPPDGMLLWQIN